MQESRGYHLTVVTCTTVNVSICCYLIVAIAAAAAVVVVA